MKVRSIAVKFYCSFLGDDAFFNFPGIDKELQKSRERF